MNENLDLTKILKNCPKGTKLYSTIFGEVEFNEIEKGSRYSISTITKEGNQCNVTSDGRHYECFDGECTLFPSKDQRDWSKFKIPQKERFDPNTLKPFDRVLAKTEERGIWYADFISVPADKLNMIPSLMGNDDFDMVIPYNDDTKHLVGTTEEAPEFYRYWEE